MSGTNTAAVALPSSTCTVPATTVLPWNRRTDDDVSVPPATGSLNTITMAALSGTSRFRGGGSVRTTTGRRLAAIDCLNRTGSELPILRTSTSTVSPAIAATGTGSNPPSMIAAVTIRVVRALLMVTVEPSGIVPGANEM